MPTRSKPRLVIEISPEQYQVLKKHLEYGYQQKVFGTIVDDIVGLLEEFGFQFVLFMLERRYSYRTLFEESRGDHQRLGNPAANPS